MDQDAPATADLTGVVYDFTVPARAPWSRVIKAGQVLRIVDLEGQQAVDFLCYDASDLGDRYSSMNTIKVQGNVYVGEGTVLYSDGGVPLLTLIADTLGRHDTVYGSAAIPTTTSAMASPPRRAATRTSPMSWRRMAWAAAPSSATSTSSCGCR